MTTTIVLIGESLLSFQIARCLDQELARHSHLKVIYLTTDPDQFYPASMTSLLSQPVKISKRAVCQHLRLAIQGIDSVNLREKYLITKDQTVSYDYLIIDQSPVFNHRDLRIIQQQAKELLNHLQAELKKGRTIEAQARFSGQNVMSYQLALALRQDSLAYQLGRNLNVQVEVNHQLEKLEYFLRQNHLNTRSTDQLTVGFTVAQPEKPFKNQKIRGLAIDQSGRAITNQFLTLEKYPEVTLIDSAKRDYHNLLRLDFSLAKQIVDNLERRLNYQHLKEVEMLTNAFLLKTRAEIFCQLSGKSSQQLTAKLADRFEQAALKKLLTRPGN